MMLRKVKWIRVQKELLHLWAMIFNKAQDSSMGERVIFFSKNATWKTENPCVKHKVGYLLQTIFPEIKTKIVKMVQIPKRKLK